MNSILIFLGLIFNWQTSLMVRSLLTLMDNPNGWVRTCGRTETLFHQETKMEILVWNFDSLGIRFDSKDLNSSVYERALLETKLKSLRKQIVFRARTESEETIKEYLGK